MADAPTFADLDLSTLPSLPELPAGAVPVGGAAAPPAGAIPLTQIPPGALSDTGAPAGAVPLASVEPGHIQSEQEHLDASPRAALVDEAVQNITSGNPDVTKYKDAYRKKAYEYSILDSDTRPKPGTGNLLQKGFAMGEDMFEGTFAAMNEATKTLGLDVMAARMKTPAERAVQPGGTPFLLLAVSTKEGEQAAHQILSTAAAKSVQAADLIRTFTNRVANKILTTSFDPAKPDPGMAQVFDTQFDHDVAVKMAVKGLEQGLSSQLPATNADTMATLAKTPALDPTMFIPAGASFEAARAGEGLAARTLADTPVTIEQHLINLAGKAAAKPFVMAGKTLSRTSELIDGNPLLKATAAAGATMAVGGDAVQSALAALLGANTKLKLLEKGGEGLSTVADRLAGRMPPGPMGRFALSVANTVGRETEGLVAGQIANLPFALGAGDEDSFKDMVTAGILMHGAMKPVGAMVNGLDVVRNLWAERPSMPETRLNVKPYGFDDVLDAAHKKVADTLGNSANNYVQSIRDYFGKQRGEVYTLYPADYDAALAKFVADGSLDATTAAQARGQQGVSLRLRGEDGEVRNLAISRVAGNTPGLSVGHESGHMLESLLSPEELSHVYQEISNTYGPEQLAAYKTRYEEMANFNRPDNVPPLSLNASQLLSEVFAEHVSAVLNSIPVHSFGEPGTQRKNLSRAVYSMVARGLEKIGAKAPQLVDFSGESGPKTGLGIQPSAKLGNLIENVLAAHTLDLPKLRYNTPSGKAPLTEAQKTLSPEEKAYLSGKAPKPKPAPPEELGGHPHPITANTPFGAAALTGKTAEDIVAPRHVENVARPVAPATQTQPNVRTTSERQNQFGEASPEQLAATHQHLDTAFAGPRHEIKPVELEYLAAKSDSSEAPNQKEREAQRVRADQLEEASKAAGLPNPLRQKYQKMAVPYGYARDDKSLVHAMSLDKVVHNVDLMQGWLHLNQEQTGKLGADLSQYLASPQLTRDLQVYLRNQSHGYAGDGRELARPADTREGTITPQDENYKPTSLPPDKAQVINLLMGMEQPGKQTPGQEFARRFAELNGIEVPAVAGKHGSVSDTNPLRAQLRTEFGFDPKMLNAAVEVLKTNRIVDLKERPDLHFHAGDTAFQRAGFMPQLSGPRLEHAVDDKALSLVHYGDQGLREINAKQFGSSGLTPRSELSGEPRSYWYVKGEENKHDPVLGRGAKYEANVSGNRIYDGDSDPLDYGSQINRSKADSMLQDEGYAGIARTGRGGYRQVELFESVKPENVQQTRKAASFMPQGQRQGNDTTRELASNYIAAHNLGTTQHTENTPVNEGLAKRIADFYDETKSTPNAPEVKKAYAALAKETMQQYAAMEKAGIQIEPYTGTGEPYKNSAEMMTDVRDNKHLWFFKTEQGFGDGKPAENALLEKSGVKINGHELLVNDVFRAVHDYFGHTAEGWEFGPRGEYNAYLTHAPMFSDAAKPALAAETLAQNSWVNFGKHLRNAEGAIPGKGEEGHKPLKERPFADQKNLVIPQHFLDEAEASARFMPSTYKQLAKHLTPEERDGLRDSTAERMAALHDELPADVDFETASKLGMLKKGWYERAGRSLRTIFGPDAETFIGLLAATSPRQSVQLNLEMALNVWEKYLQEGRSTDEETLTKLVRPLVGMNSRVNNSVRALLGKDLENSPVLQSDRLDSKTSLSGFKVDSFRRNLLGDLLASTNDSWMAQFSGIPQKIFGTKAGYLAFNAKIRRVADKLGIQPAEVQETVWSFFKTLVENTKEGRNAKSTLASLTEGDISNTSEFHDELQNNPNVSSILARLGLQDKIQRDPHSSLAGERIQPSGLSLADQGHRKSVLGRLANRAQEIKDSELAGASVVPEAPGESPF